MPPPNGLEAYMFLSCPSVYLSVCLFVHLSVCNVFPDAITNEPLDESSCCFFEVLKFKVVTEHHVYTKPILVYIFLLG